jgi:hypothetical protein
VIQVAVELIEAVVGRKVLVLIAKVVFAELTCDVAVRLEQFGDGGIFGLQTKISAGHTHLGQSGANRILAGDEGRPSSGAALLGVVIGQFEALAGDAIDVGRLVTHRAAVVVADVVPADVIPPDDKNIRFSIWHYKLSFMLRLVGWILVQRKWNNGGRACPEPVEGS